MRWILCPISLVLTLGCGPKTTGPSVTPPATATDDGEVQAARGEKAFADHCAASHGDRGEGSKKAPPLIGPAALPRRDQAPLTSRSVRWLLRTSGMSHIQLILVPMDGSPASLAALSEAVSLADELGAAVEVLHVITTDAADSAAAADDRAMETAIAAAKSLLAERLTRRTTGGDPIRKILETAEDPRVDLIVMGTHGRVGRLHGLAGSVAEAVVRNSPRPVLTVREAGGQRESFSERVHHRRGISRPSQ